MRAAGHDLDVRIGLDHAGRDYARLVRSQVDCFGRIAAELERDLLQVQDDVGGVFDYAGDRLEFV